MKWRRSGGVDDVLNLPSWLTAAFVPLMLGWLCCGAGTATARTLSARQRLGYTGPVIVRGKWPSPRPLHRSLNVRRVDCAACNHVALLTPRALLKLGLSHAAKVLDLKSRVRCRGCGARGQAVVTVKWGARERLGCGCYPATRGTRAITRQSIATALTKRDGATGPASYRATRTIKP